LAVEEHTDFGNVDSLLLGNESMAKAFREGTPHLVQLHERVLFGFQSVAVLLWLLSLRPII